MILSPEDDLVRVDATYMQIECARLVEEVRVIRDTYRAHLEDLGCRPVHEMYGVVFEYGSRTGPSGS